MAASDEEAAAYIEEIPHYAGWLVMVPERTVRGFLAGVYVWTPGAKELPARVRMRLRGELAPMIDGFSDEDDFPVTLLSW